MVEAQEVEPGFSIVHDACLLREQLQTEPLQLLPRPHQRLRCLFGGATLNHQVVRVPSQPADELLLGELCLAKAWR